MPDKRSRLPIHLAAVLIMAGTAASSAQGAEYKIDLSHSFIQFKISHLGISTTVGRFDDFAGMFTWDKDNPGDSTIEVVVKTASIDSNWAERDKHLRGEDFLNVDKFPEASFKSTGYTGDASAGTMTGILTLHGVSKPISLDVKAVGEGDDPWGGYRAGFSAATTLRRADFGIDYNLGPASETMAFELFIEGIRK